MYLVPGMEGGCQYLGGLLSSSQRDLGVCGVWHLGGGGYLMTPVSPEGGIGMYVELGMEQVLLLPRAATIPLTEGLGCILHYVRRGFCILSVPLAVPVSSRRTLGVCCFGRRSGLSLPWALVMEEFGCTRR